MAEQRSLWEPADKLAADIQDLQRMVPSQETNYATHNLHDYPARFIPHFPRVFIKHLTKTNDLVVDPMVGGGTTLIEAALLNRRGFGVDIEPIAYLTSKVATTPIDSKKLRLNTRSLLGKIKDSFDAGWKVIKLPTEKEYPNHSIWFREETLKQLLFIRNKIRQLRNPDVKDLALLALSSIVRDVSNSDPRDIFPQRDKDLLIRPKQDVLRLYAAALGRIQEKVIAFSNTVDHRKQTEVYLGDARKIKLSRSSADLVITSPPYAYAIDYARVNQLSTLLFWMDNNALKDYRKNYIGTDRISTSNGIGDFRFITFARPELERIIEKNKKSGLILYKYFHDMALVSKECYRILKQGKHLVYVIGNSTIKGSSFSTENIFIGICEEIGLKLEKRYVRPYYSYRMATKRNVHSNSIKEDIFLVFRK
jgi:DNA modification methylase